MAIKQPTKADTERIPNDILNQSGGIFFYLIELCLESLQVTVLKLCMCKPLCLLALMGNAIFERISVLLCLFIVTEIIFK